MTPSRTVSAHLRSLLPFISIAIMGVLGVPVVSAQSPRPDAVTHGTFAEAWQRGTPASAVGRLTVMYADDFANRRAERLYFVKDERTGHVVQIQFEKPPARLRTGAHLTLIGRATDGQLYVAAGQVDPSLASTPVVGTPAPTATAAADPTAGQRTIVMVGSFTDVCVTCSTNAIAQTLFNDPTGLSVSALYDANSLGQVKVSGDVVGPYPIAFASSGTCDLGAWATALDGQAAAAGVDLAAYQHRLYVLPQSTCPGAGFGTIGGTPSSAWVFVCDMSGLFAHEIGHNLGMDHASTPTSEYGDLTDPMALSENRLRGVNAPHRAQLGWLASTALLHVTKPGTYDLAALAEVGNGLPQVMVIDKPDTGESYYLSYRDAEGYDAYIDWSYYNRLSVHRYKGDGSSSKTYLLAGLHDGERFLDATNGVTVTLVSHTATTATLAVGFGCASRAPAMSVGPAVQNAAPGGSVVYTVSVSNQDGSACGSSTFALAPSVPVGWTGTLVPTTLTLSPGTAGEALLTVMSSPSAPVGSFPVTAAASDGGQPAHAASAGATYAVVDATPPSPPSALKATVNSKQKLIQLAWNASTDNVAVAGYRVFRNGVLVATASGAAWSDATWVSGASYTYSVRAYDAAGNVSGPSNQATVTLPGSGGRKK